MAPAHLVPYTLQWNPDQGNPDQGNPDQGNPDQATTAAVGRFVHLALTTDVPSGWVTEPDHLRHNHG